MCALFLVGEILTLLLLSNDLEKNVQMYEMITQTNLGNWCWMFGRKWHNMGWNTLRGVTDTE